MQTANAQQKRAMKRLMWDLAEIQTSPVNSISAAPLDDDMFEWHCNFTYDDEIYHLVLFFTENYPFKSPSAEFLPLGYRNFGGAQQDGKKGTQVCLSIFNDYNGYHTEWERDWGNGWSPGYTVQTVLLNLLSHIEDRRGDDQNYILLDKELNKGFECPDCGHTLSKPYPEFDKTSIPRPLSKVEPTEAVLTKDDGVKIAESATDNELTITCSKEMKDIICYVSRNKVKAIKPKSNEDIFGFGLEELTVYSVVDSEPSQSVNSPCEFLTADAFFSMQKSGLALSSRRTKLDHFLPVFIHPAHGEAIQDLYTDTMKLLAPDTSGPMQLISPLFSLMNVIINNIAMSGHCGVSEVVGLCFLHRLALWAAHTFPGVQEEVDRKLQDFITTDRMRRKNNCPEIEKMIVMLLVSKQYRWRDMSNCVLKECLRRQVKNNVAESPDLVRIDTEKNKRLLETTRLSKGAWQALALQVSLVEKLSPENRSRDEIIQEYDANFGFPQAELVQNIKSLVKESKSIDTYSDWFKVLGVEVPEEEQFHEMLIDSLHVVMTTKGYHERKGKWRKLLFDYMCSKDEVGKMSLRVRGEDGRVKRKADVIAKKDDSNDNGDRVGRSKRRKQGERRAESIKGRKRNAVQNERRVAAKKCRKA